MALHQQIKNIIDSIFSDSGYSINKFNVKFPYPLDINIVKDDNGTIDLTFTKELPSISWKKFITLSARVRGITLKETGGILKLKFFPDIPFSYDEENANLFGGNLYDWSSIVNDINAEYSDSENRFLANKCLHYASEWATIASQGCDLSYTSSSEKKRLKKDCKNFVMQNLKEDQDLQAGSVLLTFLFFYVVLPVVLKFILERVFKKIFS
jgi:hypothetical protein